MKIPKISKNSDHFIRRFNSFVEWFIIFGLLIFILLVCCSCSITRTVPIETIRTETKVDTIYLSNIQYDSIYVSQDLFTDRSKDTILIRQHDVEYRYKLIRDTIERVKIEIQCDSIPYEVRIETIKEVPRKRNWFDILCNICFGICSASLLITLKYKLKR